MTFATVDISFQEELLAQVDQIADNESRTRGDLIVNAVKMYVERKNEWEEYFNIGQKIGSKLKISEDDVIKEIKTYRQEKNQ